MVLISLVAAVLPVTLYLVWLRKADKYDKEPLRLYLKNIAWGSFGAIFFTLLGSALVSTLLSGYFSSDELAELTDTVLVAPVVEELMKGIFLFTMISKSDFDNLTDGLVYGGAIGLGFGMTENFLYFLSASSGGEWLFLVVFRTLFSCVMHFISTAVFGAFLGISKFSSPPVKLFSAISGYLIAVIIHFTWNSAVVVEESFWLGPLFMIGAVFLFRTLFRYSIKQEYSVIKRELSEEAASGYFPASLIPLVLLENPVNNYPFDSRTAGSIKQDAVKLAFRKEQLLHAKGHKAEYFRNEIESLRRRFYDLSIISRQDLTMKEESGQ